MPKQAKPADKKQEKKIKESHYFNAVGRRRESSARVRLYTVVGDSIQVNNKEIKAGEIIVNSRSIADYFSGSYFEKIYMEPFRTTNTVGRFAVSALVSGGGQMGQLGAFIHGVARALTKVDKEKFQPLLRKRGFMTRDPRTKERRKAGLAQKARAKKQSPKR